MLLEITYLYQEDKHSDQQTGYTYFHSKTDDFAKSVGEASKYFTKYCRENGFTKKVTLKSIITLQNENTTCPHIILKPPTNRKRSRSTQGKTTSSPSRKKSSSQTRTKKDSV
jgi:hypothetical protein